MTSRVSAAAAHISDPMWQFELAALAAANPRQIGTVRPGTANWLLQWAANALAALSVFALLLRYGGTAPAKARPVIAGSPYLAALHAEDTTRTRHLRGALEKYRAASPSAQPAILLLGRPAGTVASAAEQLDVQELLDRSKLLRPLSLGSLFKGLPQAFVKLARGPQATGGFPAPLPFRERLAIAYRMVQGAAHAAWWNSAASGLAPAKALFGHTGTADTSQLEAAMQDHGWRTVHAVHGTNIGWPFAGLSDVAVFQTGADARLGASLPAYGNCTHLPLTKPEVSRGNGDWALLTSYTHLLHPDFAEHGSALDRRLIGWVRAAAEQMGQDPARIFWRPHPQIDLVDPAEKRALENAVADAGFSRWPAARPYEWLGSVSAAITTPSTVLTDALRLGQPAIVASLSEMQRDLLYGAHPLLVQDEASLSNALRTVLEPQSRASAFMQAWDAVQPGDKASIPSLLDAASA
ncbi:hypothetical protein [Pontixanthobacter luteolus]|uniref:hypothetical protein n=1 Tax=Pontixanthobacter luteolus TaxID=295089 RepID=UPI0023048BF9|nr:hypothetical protein [Pontixanthobacter luteolus]